MKEAFIRLELRIILSNRKKAAAGSEQAAVAHRLRQIIVGRDLFFSRAVRILDGGEQLRAGLSDLREHTLFEASHTLYRGDNIRNQISAPLHLVLYFSPLRIDVLFLGDQ